MTRRPGSNLSAVETELRRPTPGIPDASLPDAFAGLLDVLEAIPKLSGPLLDSSSLDNRDPDLIARVAPLFYAIARYYFRTGVDGLENLPLDGPALFVGNHSAPPLLPDALVAAAWWITEMGTERPAYALVHDLPLRIPVLGNLMMKVGCLRATRENAEKALAAGAPVLIYPGGDAEAMRSFRDRNRVDLRGHTGFVEMAFRQGVPIVPFANVGGAEVYFTLFSGERLARWSGFRRLTRVKALPLIAGLPWGLWFTSFLPYLPLPTKMTFRVGAPIMVERDPELAKDRAVVQRVYGRVVRSLQTMVDDMAAERWLPVIG